MSTTVRITLLAGTCGVAPVPPHPHSEEGPPVLPDYPPSPWRLLQNPCFAGEPLAPLVQLLAAAPPEYHLPYGQLLDREGGRRPSPGQLNLGAGTAIHISWPVDLPAELERQFGAALAGMTCLGQAEDTAIWQVVPQMPTPNCLPSPDGTIRVLCCAPAPASPPEGHALELPPQWVRYRYTPARVLPPHAADPCTHANRALYAVSASSPLHATTGILWTDRLHRALLQRAPRSSLFSGLLAGQPLPEDQRAWFRWEEKHGAIAVLEVLAPQPFDVAELEALQNLRMLHGYSGVEVALQLLRLDPLPFGAERTMRTATPMLLYTTPRAGKPHRSPAAQAIQSLLWGAGEEGKLDPACFQQLGSALEVCVHHPVFGRIVAKAEEATGPQSIVNRGDRRAACSQTYHVQLQSDQPLPLLGVGWGRHFGAGRLVPSPPDWR